MPTLEAAGQKQLLLHQLIAGLPNSVSKQLRATGQTNDIDNVLERARLLLMMDKQEHLAAMSEGSGKLTGELQHMQQQIAALTEQVALLTTASKPKTTPHCYNCQQPGYIQCQCPLPYPQHQNQQRQCFNWQDRPFRKRLLSITFGKRLRDVCDGEQASPTIGQSDTIIVATVHTSTSVINACIGGVTVEAMLDSGSTISLLHQNVVSRMSNLPAI